MLGASGVGLSAGRLASRVMAPKMEASAPCDYPRRRHHAESSWNTLDTNVTNDTSPTRWRDGDVDQRAGILWWKPLGRPREASGAAVPKKSPSGLVDRGGLAAEVGFVKFVSFVSHLFQLTQAHSNSIARDTAAPLLSIAIRCRRAIAFESRQSRASVDDQRPERRIAPGPHAHEA